MLLFKQIRAAITLFCLGFSTLSLCSAQRTYTAIYVFGDSYSDVGNFYIVTGGVAPTSPPYYNGAFSNGPLWVEHIASTLGLPLLPELAGGNDYAVAGAWVTQPQAIDLFTVLDVPHQVLQYLNQHGGKADPNALYILQGGINDIVGNLSTTGVTPVQLGFQIAQGLSDSELMLRRAGARNFLIPNLFNVALLAVAQPNPDFAAAATTATNRSLNKFLTPEMTLQGIRILRIDLYSLFTAIQSDATHFGFTNIDTPCLGPDNFTVCADPHRALFWDIYHLADRAQSLVAMTAVNALNHSSTYDDDDQEFPARWHGSTPPNPPVRTTQHH